MTTPTHELDLIVAAFESLADCLDARLDALADEVPA